MEIGEIKKGTRQPILYRRPGKVIRGCGTQEVEITPIVKAQISPQGERE